MGTMRAVSVIFYTGDTYYCYSKNVYFVELEEKILPIKIKGIAKFFKIYDFFLLNILSRVRVDLLLHPRIRPIMFLCCQSICASFTHKSHEHQKDARVPP